MLFKVEIKESKTENLSDKELMALYKKYRKQNKNKEAEALIDEIDKRGLKESSDNIEVDIDVHFSSGSELMAFKKVLKKYKLTLPKDDGSYGIRTKHLVIAGKKSDIIEYLLNVHDKGETEDSLKSMYKEL